MGVVYILVSVLLSFIAITPMEIFAGCREAQLPRDCEALCTGGRHGVESCELRVAVLLPADPRYEIALPRVLPVLGKKESCLRLRRSFSLETLCDR